MFELQIARLSSLLQQVEAQDGVLRELSQHKGGIVQIASARPITALFKEARGLLTDIPEYDYHGDPFSARSQITALRAKITNAIGQFQADEASYSERNRLKVPPDKALALLKTRGSEGAAFKDSYIVAAGEPVQGWLTNITRTFDRIFATPWHARHFEERTKKQVGDESEADIAARAFGYLTEVTEDLFLCGSEKPENDRGDAVFIAHGQSSDWRDLKDYLQDTLKVQHIEFNSDAVAGYGTYERIADMLHRSQLAFLVFTAEDQQMDGSFRARENVVYEAGMWMGRFGPKRAIILRDRKCSVQSNLGGITRLDFNKEQIKETFSDVREGEGVLPPERR